MPVTAVQQQHSSELISTIETRKCQSEAWCDTQNERERGRVCFPVFLNKAAFLPMHFTMAL